MKIRFYNGCMHRDDWLAYVRVCDDVKKLFIEGHGGITIDGVDYIDGMFNSSKEDIEAAIEFLQAILFALPTNEQFYGEY